MNINYKIILSKHVHPPKYTKPAKFAGFLIQQFYQYFNIKLNFIDQHNHSTELFDFFIW
jgi:hypothetical protein